MRSWAYFNVEGSRLVMPKWSALRRVATKLRLRDGGNLPGPSNPWRSCRDFLDGLARGAVPVRASPRHPTLSQWQRARRTAPVRRRKNPKTIRTTTPRPAGKPPCEPHRGLPAGTEVAVRASRAGRNPHAGGGSPCTHDAPMRPSPPWERAGEPRPGVVWRSASNRCMKRGRNPVVRLALCVPLWLGMTSTALRAACPRPRSHRTVLLALRPLCLLPWCAWRYRLWGTTVPRTVCTTRFVTHWLGSNRHHFCT